MTERASEPNHSNSNREHIWLVALYEKEDRVNELLDRLSAIGVDTSEATTLRVEVDEEMRQTKLTALGNPLSPIVRGAVAGALLGGALALLCGMALYFVGALVLPLIAGLFHHALFSVIVGAAIGAMAGAVLSTAKQKKAKRAKPPKMPILKSEGFLVTVKMPPPLAERAEEIARGLGAKEILL
ncbi:MAG: hypothetical protein JNJ50_30205 [Acidobacteria bacterium]|nr:hypothetical protein [Acidobacteriota bacterium]